MPAALGRRFTFVSLLLLGGGGTTQAQSAGAEPLRKSDLLRLLSVGTLGSGELAALVRRTCLSFTPTSRDRADLVALGADSVVLREIDQCARRGAPVRAAPRAAAVRPRAPPVRRPRADSVKRVVAMAPAAAIRAEPRDVPRLPLSAALTGFVLGGGQRGAVGSRPPVPVIFQVRDTAGAPVVGEAVTFGVTNGLLGVSRAVTDSAGSVRVDLTLGPKAGLTLVRAAVRAMEREATLYAQPGAPARLLLRCGDTLVEGRIALTTHVPVVFRVAGQDAFGNVVPVSQVEAATGDKNVLRVVVAGADSLGGVVRVIPGEPGSTSLVIVSSGQREDFTAVVWQTRHTGAACP